MVVTSWIALIGFGAGIAFFAWTIFSTSRMNVCIACKRPIHAETRTVALVDGHKTVLCCPGCTRILRERRGRRVEVVTVTDYSSGEPLDARAAFVVAGSDVNLCLEHTLHVDAARQPVPRSFDRCSPSMIAFAKPDDAREFQREHGGELIAADLAFAFQGRGGEAAPPNQPQ
jgi:hypothetical protein